MIKDLHEFRENIFDIFVYEEDGKLILGDCGDDRTPKEEYHKLYKECSIEELPKKFRERIKEHENAGYRGMGAGLVHDDYFFSNISGKSLYHCFKRVDKIPKFNVKLKNLTFQYVKNFIEKNNLEIRCPLRRYQFEEEENFVSGKLYVSLNYQEYFEKENSTGIEEMDEFFFWKGRNYKTLSLDFNYNYDKKYSDSIDEKETRKKIENEILSLFNDGNRDIFANEWKVL